LQPLVDLKPFLAFSLAYLTTAVYYKPNLNIQTINGSFS
jgi:hypothetical protein